MRLLLILLLGGLLYAAPTFLLPRETAWLERHTEPFRVAVTEIPNQVIKTPKGLSGFSIDLFRYLQKTIQHPFTFIYYPTWQAALEAVKNGEAEILFLAQKTPSRLQFLDFTDTVLTLHNHLVTAIHTPVRKIEKLKNVAVVEGSAIEEYIQSHYPSLSLVKTKNEKEALLCVTKKACDATIMEPVRAAAYMQQTAFNDLIIGPHIGYDYYLAIATTKTEPQLNIILTKAFHNIDPEEIEALKHKWGYIDTSIDPTTIIVTTTIALLFALLSLFLYILNRRYKLALNTIKELQKQRENLITQTISTISHHWRQPLNTLSMLVDLLKMRYEQKEIDAAFIEYFYKKAKSYINHLSESIELFRSFKITEEKSECDLIEIIKEVIAHITKEYPNIRILLHAPQRIQIQSYPNNIKKLFATLFQNSIDAGSKTITVIVQHKDSITITISDNGSGIDCKIKDKIFEPYFSTKEEKNDVGLGLYIAKLIVENYLEGTIALKKCKPATFSIHFKEHR